MQPWFSEYVAAQRRALDSIALGCVEQLVNTVRQGWLNDRQIFAMGNGGNAASAALRHRSRQRCQRPGGDAGSASSLSPTTRHGSRLGNDYRLTTCSSGRSRTMPAPAT